MSRVALVTGSTGFIGNAVARRFAQAGYEVHGLTRSEDKAKSLLRDEITPVIGDYQKPETYEAILKKASVVIHCASSVSNSPYEDEKVLVDAVAKASAAASTKKLLIFTSGCLIYGGKICPETYLNEDSELNIPSWLQWRKKSEDLVLKNTDLVGVVTRPGFLYGGSGSYTAPYFAMGESKKPIVSGSPDKKWGFVHFSDLAEGYYLIAQAPKSVVQGEIFNFGDGTRSTLKEVITAAAKAAGYDGEITYVPAGNDFMGVCAEQTCLLDSSKARKLLGWNPNHSGFVENIRRYYASWKAHQK